jgi:hypothetical protein
MAFCIFHFTPGVFDQTRERIFVNSSQTRMDKGLQAISSIDILDSKNGKN